MSRDVEVSDCRAEMVRSQTEYQTDSESGETVAGKSQKRDELPALQFYPGDWRKDPGVQALSYHDRGVWFEMLCLMHESAERGKLILNGKAIPEEALGRLLGLDNQTLNQTITNLFEYGVASRDEETGAIISRRMVRDERIRQVRRVAGSKGGNPNLLKQTSNQTPTPSVSFSASSSEEESAPPAEFDWLRVEAEFFARWNSLPGTVHRTVKAIPHNLVRDFQRIWFDEKWRAVAEKALKRLEKPFPPGPDGPRFFSLKMFCRQSDLEDLAEGNHGWLKPSGVRKDGRTNAPAGDGSTDEKLARISQRA